MKVVPIPCLKDNYAYLIICPSTGSCGVVDPSQAAPVLRTVTDHHVDLVAIFNTHHHWDHVGGNEELLSVYPNLSVYGHESDRGRIPGQTMFLKDQQPIALGLLNGHVTHNPGHTTGALTYYFEDAAFTGDTMFAAGCGRLFEGSAEQMYQSLNQIIGSHPKETKVYFGHEYTENNLRFALSVEPNNAALTARLEQTQAKRASGDLTTPSTLADEWATNPFMRWQSSDIQNTVKQIEPDNDLQPASVLRVIRALKDKF